MLEVKKQLSKDYQGNDYVQYNFYDEEDNAHKNCTRLLVPVSINDDKNSWQYYLVLNTAISNIAKLYTQLPTALIDWLKVPYIEGLTKLVEAGFHLISIDKELIK